MANPVMPQALSSTCFWCRTTRQASSATAAWSHVIVQCQRSSTTTYILRMPSPRLFVDGMGKVRHAASAGTGNECQRRARKALVGSASISTLQHRHDAVNLVPVHKSRIFICRRAVASRNAHPKQGPIPSLSASHLMTRCLDASARFVGPARL
ncbi:hypothetical protein E4U39_000842 [Claviceps sp. Clav50 group G5]|nr:hypothetical protein E4U39_000842 [Claviceps sp. Clav50 group G5]